MEKYTLKNGLQVCLENIQGKKTISCDVLIKQGAKDETKDTNGLSHLVEHLALKMNSRYSTNTAKENTQLLLENGISYNGTTYKEYTTFSLDGLASDSNLMIEHLFYIVAGKDKVTEEELESEKKVVIQEARAYLSSTAQIADRVNEMLWGHHSYGNMVIGPIENIMNFTGQMIDDLIERTYTPDNAVINIIGEFHTREIKNTIEKYFGQWTGKVKKSSTEDIQARPKVKIFSEYGKERSVVALGIPTYPVGDERCQWIEVLKHIFILPNGPIMLELREKRGLIYSINKYTNAFSSAGNLGIHFSSENSQAYEILSVLLQQLNQLAQDGIDEGMLQILKKRRKLEVLRAFERTEEYIKLANVCAMNGIEMNVDDILEQIEGMSTQGMNQIVKDLLVRQNIGIIVLGKLEESSIQTILNKNI